MIKVNKLLQKRSFILMMSCMLSLTFVASTCDDDDDDNSGQADAQVQSALTGSTWQVTYFFDDTDETYHFEGYNFAFNSDGSVQAVSPSKTVSGTWSAQKSSNNSSKLVLNFGPDEPFEELNDDWNIIERSDTRITLQDVSGGSGEIDYLTLEKQ
jgi:hypothetical protein